MGEILGNGMHSVNQAIWVDDSPCEGRFEIEPLVETDLLLHLTDEGCRVEILGAHAQATVEHRYVPETEAPAP